MKTIITLLALFTSISGADSHENRTMSLFIEGTQEEKYIGEFYVSNYYTPVRGQKKYFNGSYQADFYVNCQGDCTITASGSKLDWTKQRKVLACPPNFKFGTKIKLVFPYDHKEHPSGELIATCEDRGGAIKNKRLDLWVGMGEQGGGTPWVGEWSGRGVKAYLVF